MTSCPLCSRPVGWFSPRLADGQRICTLCSATLKTKGIDPRNVSNAEAARAGLESRRQKSATESVSCFSDPYIEKLPARLERALQRTLQPGEPIVFKLKGTFKEGLICTDSRVIILKGGYMTGQIFGTTAFQVPYTNVAGAQVTFHLISGYFEVSTGGMPNTSKSYWSQDKATAAAKAPNCVSLVSGPIADKFRQACGYILHRSAEVRVAAAPVVAPPRPTAVPREAPATANDQVLQSLERLAQLKANGVLTEEEFLAKKQELLARL